MLERRSSARDACDEQPPRVELIEKMVGDLLGLTVALTSAANDCDRVRVPLLETPEVVLASPRHGAHHVREPREHGFHLVFPDRDDPEVDLSLGFRHVHRSPRRGSSAATCARLAVCSAEVKWIAAHVVEVSTG